ncbi:hypothetical protein DFJ73DRAFT_814579 [Zopfochytrium polystomum]|nr:hypothetical protein DFJ73DRAFT_814579 [Zopfochytrium polystomum]
MLNDQNEPVEFYDLQCMNVCVAKQRFEEHEKLALDYEKQVRDLKSEFAVFIDERNTWSKQEHFKFEKIRLEYKHTEGTHLVMERLRTEFPDLPLSVLKTHLEWCRQHVLFKQKLNCCRIRFNEERRKFEKETPAIFKQATAKVVAEMENAHEKEQLFCKLSEAHEKLRAWQAQLQSVLAVKMEEEKKKMEEESERLAEREARRLKEAQEKRAMVTARKHDLEMHEMFWASLAAKLESETKMDQFVQAKHHKERASYRMSLHSQKIEAVEVKRLAMEKMQKALEDRLALLRSTVAVEAKRDWNRTIQGTESSSAAKFVAPSPLFKNPSFTNDAILRDKRSKVSLALFDKGLLATDYARQYLISLCKPVPSTLLVHNNGEDVGHGA